MIDRLIRLKMLKVAEQYYKETLIGMQHLVRQMEEGIDIPFSAIVDANEPLQVNISAAGIRLPLVATHPYQASCCFNDTPYACIFADEASGQVIAYSDQDTEDDTLISRRGNVEICFYDPNVLDEAEEEID